MKIWIWACAASVVAAAACTKDPPAGKVDDTGAADTGDTGDTGDTQDTGPIEVRAGGWFYTEGDYSADTCNLFDQGALIQHDGSFFLENNNDGTFHVAFDDGTEEFNCAQTDPDFECDSRWVHDEDLSDLGMSAVLEFNAVMEGTFSSGTNMSGTQTATITCDGDDCASVEGMLGGTFPCTLTAAFTAEALPQDTGAPP